MHVKDICQAIRLSLMAPEDDIRGQIFNVGDTDSNYRIIDVATIVSETFPGCKLTVGESDGDNRSYKVGFDKIRKVLPGFKCEWTPERGARQLRTLFEAIHLTDAGWRAITLRLIPWFLFLSALNEVAWRTLSTDRWTDLKSIGLPILTMVFFLTLSPLFERHLVRPQEPAEGTET